MGVAATPALLMLMPGLVGSDRSDVVVSGSMAPSVQTGDLAFLSDVGPSQPLRVGDVIAFRPAGQAGPTVLHRIVEREARNGTEVFVTKGDANGVADAGEVSRFQVVGIFDFRIPMYGYIVAFAKSAGGILAFVVLPSVIAIVHELRVMDRLSKAGKAAGSDVAAVRRARPTSTPVAARAPAPVPRIPGRGGLKP